MVVNSVTKALGIRLNYLITGTLLMQLTGEMGRNGGSSLKKQYFRKKKWMVPGTKWSQEH